MEASGEALSKGLKEVMERLEDNPRKHSGLIAEDLHGNLKKLGAGIKAELEGLQKEIAGEKDSFQKSLGKAMETLKGNIEKSVAFQLKALDEPSEQVHKELNRILEEVKRVPRAEWVADQYILCNKKTG